MITQIMKDICNRYIENKKFCFQKKKKKKLGILEQCSFHNTYSDQKEERVQTGPKHEEHQSMLNS